jgi:hypothetical protein
LDSDLSFSSCGQRDNYHCHRNMQLIWEPNIYCVLTGFSLHLLSSGNTIRTDGLNSNVFWYVIRYYKLPDVLEECSTSIFRYSENGSNTFHWNVRKFLLDHLAPHPITRQCSVTTVTTWNLTNWP